MKLIKIVIIYLTIALLVSCNHQVNAHDDIKKYYNYQQELEQKITQFLTGKISEEKLISILDEYKQFIEKSSFKNDLKSKQLRFIRLYAEGITENDGDKISDAAFLNLEINDMLNAK